MSNQDRVYRFFDKCAYKDCMNGKRNGKRLYRFPLQKDERYHLWIRNSGKCFVEIYKLCFYFLYIIKSLNIRKRNKRY